MAGRRSGPSRVEHVVPAGARVARCAVGDCVYVGDKVPERARVIDQAPACAPTSASRRLAIDPASPAHQRF